MAPYVSSEGIRIAAAVAVLLFGVALLMGARAPPETAFRANSALMPAFGDVGRHRA